MAVRKILRAGSDLQTNPVGGPNWNSIRVDSSSDVLVFGTGTSGTTTKTVADLTSAQTLAGNTTFSGTSTFNGNIVQAATSTIVAGNLVDQITQPTATNSATIPAANVVNALLTGTPTGAATYTTDTATLILGVIPNATVNSSFWWMVKNTSGGANTITVAGGSGVTVTGTATITQNNIRTFLGIVTNVGTPAVTLFSVGGSAF